MKLNKGASLRDALLLVAGLLIGIFGSFVVSRSSSDQLEVQTRPPIAGTQANRTEVRDEIRETEGLESVGAALDADRVGSSESLGTVVAIGPPMDADAEFLIRSSSDVEKIVLVGEPLDADSPP